MPSEVSAKPTTHGHVNPDYLSFDAAIQNQGPMLFGRREMELYLMKTWCTKSYLTLSRGHPFVESDRIKWRDMIPDIALENKHLLPMLFAISGLQLATESVGSEKMYSNVRLALTYHNDAVDLVTHELRSLGKHNVVPLFAFTALNAVFTVVSDQLPARPDDCIRSSFDSFLTSIKSIAATAPLWTQNVDLARNTIFDPDKDQHLEQEPGDAPNFEAPLAMLRRIFVIEAKMWKDDEARAQTYEETLQFFEHVCLKYRHSCIMWLIEMRAEMMGALQRKELLAILILILWAVCANTRKELWWARFVASRLIRHLTPTIRGMHGEECDNFIEWAERQA